MTLGSILVAVLWWVLQLLFWSFLLVLFAVWYAQGYILYLPTIGGRSGVKRKLSLNSYGTRSPSEINLKYDEFFLQTTDGVLLHTWFLPHPTLRSTAPTILFFHGNAGNIGNRLYNAQQLIGSANCNVVLVEYRGYGNSTGVPSEHGFHLDALCALDFFKARCDIDTNRIYLFGRSLGGAVAIWLAVQRPNDIAGLIVENTFTSIEDMVIELLGQHLPTFRALSPTWHGVLRRFLYLFMTSHWYSLDIMSKIKVDTLMISGAEDELIPPAQMKKLFGKLPNNIYKQFFTVEDGTHNDTYVRGGDEYFEVFRHFLEQGEQ